MCDCAVESGRRSLNIRTCARNEGDPEGSCKRKRPVQGVVKGVEGMPQDDRVVCVMGRVGQRLPRCIVRKQGGKHQWMEGVAIEVSCKRSNSRDTEKRAYASGERMRADPVCVIQLRA